MEFSLGATTDNKPFESVGTIDHTTLENTSAYHEAETTSLTRECILVRLNETGYLPWKNPDNIVNEEVEAYADKIKDFVLAFCFLIGGPANVINMAVFFRQGLQDRVNLCLFTLAVSDELFLFSAFCLHAENIYLHLISEVVVTPMNEFMANNNLIFVLSAGFVSCGLTAIIACERCYCVLRPLKYQTLLQTRTMAVIILSLCVCVFSLFFIVAYRYWIGCVFDPVTGEVSVRITGGGLYRTHKLLIDRLDSIFFGAGVPGGMMIVVITTTIITTMKLHQIVTWRSKTSSSLSPREVALTKMLIGNSVLFIICVSPSCVFRIVFFFMPEMSAGGRHHNFYFASLWIFEGFGFMNSSFNFFIYYGMGSRYRLTFRRLFRWETQHSNAVK